MMLEGSEEMGVQLSLNFSKSKHMPMDLGIALIFVLLIVRCFSCFNCPISSISDMSV